MIFNSKRLNDLEFQVKILEMRQESRDERIDRLLAEMSMLLSHLKLTFRRIPERVVLEEKGGKG